MPVAGCLLIVIRYLQLAPLFAKEAPSAATVCCTLFTAAAMLHSHCYTASLLANYTAVCLCKRMKQWNPLCSVLSEVRSQDVVVELWILPPGSSGGKVVSPHSNNTPPMTPEQHTKLNSFIFHFLVEVRSEEWGVLTSFLTGRRKEHSSIRCTHGTWCHLLSRTKNKEETHRKDIADWTSEASWGHRSFKYVNSKNK